MEARAPVCSTNSVIIAMNWGHFSCDCMLVSTTREQNAVVLCTSVCPPQASTISKRLNEGTGEQRHTIAQGL